MHYEENALFDENGDLVRRPITSSKWSRPDVVEVHHRNLVYGYTKERTEVDVWPRPDVQGSPRMFKDFLDLDVYDPEKIAKFSSKWGILDIQRFSEEFLKRPWADTKASDKRARYWFARGSRPFRYLGKNRNIDYAFGTEQIQVPENLYLGFEPLYIWRYWHRLITAALRVGSDLSNVIDHWEDWLFLTSNVLDFQIHDDNKKNEEVQSALNDLIRLDRESRSNVFDAVIEEFMIVAGVELEFRSYPVRSLEIRTHSLFAGLIVQLSAALAGSGGYVICSSCKRIYTPRRQPRANMENHYCKRRACQKFANAARVRAKRERDKEAKTLVDSLATKEKKRVKSG